jgi:glycine/D-amino acid oxidase-like deaminating enzyme
VSPDFLILRGGIAGPSAEYFLAERGRVVLLEREDTLGYHTAALATGSDLPADLVERGLTPSVLLPDRLYS